MQKKQKGEIKNKRKTNKRKNEKMGGMEEKQKVKHVKKGRKKKEKNGGKEREQ